MPDEWGGIAIDEDEFGGIAVESESEDIPVRGWDEAEAPAIRPVAPPKITLSPLEKAQVASMERGLGLPQTGMEPGTEFTAVLPSAIRRVVADPALGLARGVVGVPEAIVGLADIPTGGAVGKVLEAGGYGFQPKITKEFISEFESPELKQAKAEVAKAKGFGASVSALVQHPSAIVDVTAESIPSMIGGAAAGKKIASTIIPKVAQTARAIIGGAGGEGLVTSGQTAEQLRQESKSGFLSPKQSALAASSGAATGLISVMGGKLAARLGVDDIDTLLAGGASQAEKKGVLKRVIGSAMSEGALEELPQSIQEQIQQNVALGKTWNEGVLEAGASGMLAGFSMGGVGGISGPSIGAPQEAAPPAPITGAVLRPPAATAVPIGIERPSGMPPAPTGPIPPKPIPGMPPAPTKPVPPKSVAPEPVVPKPVEPVAPVSLARQRAKPYGSVSEFVEDINKPDTQLGNNLSTGAGLSVKSIADLESLAKERDASKAEEHRLLSEAKKMPAGPERDSKFNQSTRIGQRSQLATEAIQVATDLGQWSEKENLKYESQLIGERPLPWHKNPEVAKWLLDNSKRLGWIHKTGEQPFVAELRSSSAAKESRTLPEPIKGERLVTVQRADGTKYLASFGDKSYDMGEAGKFPSVARYTDDGQWSHGMVRAGDKIIEDGGKSAMEPTATPPTVTEPAPVAPVKVTGLDVLDNPNPDPIVQRQILQSSIRDSQKRIKEWRRGPRSDTPVVKRQIAEYQDRISQYENALKELPAATTPAPTVEKGAKTQEVIAAENQVPLAEVETPASSTTGFEKTTIKPTSKQDYSNWENKDQIHVRIGGSHRLLRRQMDAFETAGIPIRTVGSYTLGSKAKSGVIPDSIEARNLLKDVGGSVSNKRWSFLNKSSPYSEPTPPAVAEKAMGAAAPAEFSQPERANAFRAFEGWTGRAKEALQRVKEYFTPPQVGALPEVEIQSGAILPRLPDYAKEKVIASAPHGMAKVPGLGALVDTRAFAHTPADAAFLARANSVSKGKTFAALWAQTQWRNKDLFQVDADTGSFRLANGQRGYLSDVIEAELRDPGSQPITHAQWQWIHNEWKPVLDEMNRMMHNEGVRRISTEDMDFEIGKDYFPRPAIGKRNRPATGAGGRPAGRPGAKQFFQKARQYSTEEEGARLGTPEDPKEEIIYDPDPISRVTKFISGAYRSIADHRLANDPALGAGTVPDYWGIGRQTMAGPAFAGKIYPVEVAQKIERQFAQDIRGWVRATANTTAAAKAFMATGDLSGPFIQGAAMFGRNPVRWARATLNSYRALTNPTYVARLMEHPRYKALAEGYSQSGGSLLQLQDFLSGLQEGQLATRTPVFGPLLKATGRAYGAFLDLAKLELFDAWKNVTPQAEMPRLVETIENSLFMGRMEQAGMNPHRAIGERLLLFAPSYYRGAGGLLSTALQKGVSGKVARQMLGGYAAAATLVSMSAYLAMGMDWDEIQERLQPGRGKFLKVPVSLGDGERIEVGIGNILTQLVRLAGQAANYHTSNKPIDTGVEANPYLRFLRGRSAFLPGVSIELATGRDYFGNRITAKESIARHFAPFVFQSMFPRDEASLSQRIGDSAFTFFGLNAYPESEYEKARTLMDETARKVGGKPFSQLNVPQRSAVVKQFRNSPDYKKREPSPTDMERIIHINAERQANLQKAIGDSADKLARMGLRVPGYRSTIQYAGVDVPMTEVEREYYQDMLAAMYRAQIARLNEKTILSKPLAAREKWWSEQAEKIGVAARKRLTQDIAQNKIR